jgi:hypothetical protein
MRILGGYLNPTRFNNNNIQQINNISCLCLKPFPLKPVTGLRESLILYVNLIFSAKLWKNNQYFSFPRYQHRTLYIIKFNKRNFCVAWLVQGYYTFEQSHKQQDLFSQMLQIVH